MLPKNTKIKLIQNKTFCFEEFFDNNRLLLNISEEDIKWFCKTINVCLRNSAFIYFYNIVAFPPKGRGEELLTLDQIIKYYNEPYMLDELKEKYHDASKRFIQFTSIEGGGSYFYDNQTEKVYDVTWGQEEDMINGILTPWFDNFYDFLEWYYSED